MFLIVGKLRSDSSGSDAAVRLKLVLVLLICLAASLSIRMLYLSMINYTHKIRL